jgi:hypothetical protein
LDILNIGFENMLIVSLLALALHMAQGLFFFTAAKLMKNFGIWFCGIRFFLAFSLLKFV